MVVLIWEPKIFSIRMVYLLLKKFIGEGICFTFKIQGDKTKYCGQMSLYLLIVLYCLNQGDKFTDRVLSLKISVRIPVNSFGSRFLGSSISDSNTKELDLNLTR